MQFTQHTLDNIKNPILAPEGFELMGINQDGLIEFINQKTGRKESMEAVFIHHQNTIGPDPFCRFFPSDAAVVLLFGPNSKLYIQLRDETLIWEPNKIDLASIVGQRRALLVGGHFENESFEDTAVREINEETGISPDRLSKNNFRALGEHYNPTTREHQTVFAYQTDVVIGELNQNIKQGLTQEVSQWFEQDYSHTMDEYFGDQIDKYAGGAKLRPVNFISNPEIKKKLDGFYKSL